MSAETIRVHTVCGTIASDKLGFVLPHEHLLNDMASGNLQPDPLHPDLLEKKVTPELAWILREHPYGCRDNCGLDSVEDATEECEYFRHLGGDTVIEVTPQGQGRDRVKLQGIAKASGVTIISGGGWYLEQFHPEATRVDDVDELVDMLYEDYTNPSDGINSGVIGEIGISPRMTEREIKSLRAACRLQKRIHLPMYVHLPGWTKLARDVIRIALDEEGVPAEALCLCHMDPSGNDPQYQLELAQSGAHLEFDMLGMPYNYRYPGEGQSPSAAQTTVAVSRLVDEGFAQSLLFSHDMFLKSMLRKNGGNGLAYVFEFLERLSIAGIDPAVIQSVNTSNVRRLFEQSAQVTKD
ncbi:phosphotriesterase [Bifidobacterium aquikefiricola]|uniref:Aryldialkylphosphatase n=1 Tax=Bifidobacterium aquikefiricola TaxID=3059038 RepID=A0AB39U5N1_9BIFI